MAKRYYLTDVVQVVVPGIGTVNTVALSGHGVSYVSEIKTDANGQPLLPWALCRVSGNKHGQIIADTRNQALPDVSLDMKVTAMAVVAKNRFKADLEARGIDASFINTVDAYRDSIREIGLKLNPNFNENNFDVSE